MTADRIAVGDLVSVKTPTIGNYLGYVDTINDDGTATIRIDTGSFRGTFATVWISRCEKVNLEENEIYSHIGEEGYFVTIGKEEKTDSRILSLLIGIYIIWIAVIIVLLIWVIRGGLS